MNAFDYFLERDRPPVPPRQRERFALGQPPKPVAPPATDIDELLRRVTAGDVEKPATGRPVLLPPNDPTHPNMDANEKYGRPLLSAQPAAVTVNNDANQIPAPNGVLDSNRPQLRPYEPMPTPPPGYIEAGEVQAPVPADNRALSPHVQFKPDDPINAPSSPVAPGDDPALFEQREPLEVQRQKLSQLLTLPVKNKEAQSIDPKTGRPGRADVKGRIKDALREAVIAAGQQVRANGGIADWGTLGAAAAGGVGGAIDPSQNEKRVRLRDIAETRGQIGELEDQQATDLNVAHKQAQIRTIGEDDARKRDELKQKEKAAESLAKYRERKADQGDLKLFGDAELREMRDRWARENTATANRRLAAVEKEMDNRMKRSEADRASREKIAGAQQSGADRRAALTIEARKTLEVYKAAQAAGRQQEALAARKELERIKREADAVKD